VRTAINLDSAKAAQEQVTTLYWHNPRTTGLYFGLAIAGLVLIGLWGLYGDWFLGNLIAVTVSEVLTLAYVVAVALAAGKLVRERDRWQVESALTFRQMLAEAKSFSGDSQAGSPFYAKRLRVALDRDIKHAREVGTSVAMIAFRVELLSQAPSHPVFVQANGEVAELLSLYPETIACPTALGMFEYAFYIRNADSKSVRAITSFIERSLPRYECHFGVAVLDEDGKDAESLLKAAMSGTGWLSTVAA
jgi:hypothetical protein